MSKENDAKVDPESDSQKTEPEPVSGSYYYDDSTGYELYEPEEDEEQDEDDE
jgi:hypothetical protein